MDHNGIHIRSKGDVYLVLFVTEVYNGAGEVWISPPL